MIRHFLNDEMGEGDKALGLVAIFIALMVAVTQAVEWTGVLKPRPYRDVQLISIEHRGNGLHLVAGYTKTRAACELDRVVVFGAILGEVVPLPFTPVRAGNVGEQRTEGRQRMHLIIDDSAEQFTAVEVRTRHSCDGKWVSGTMIRAEVPH